MPKRMRSYDDWLMKQLVDPIVAANYIRAAIDDSREMFLVALRNIAEAHRMAKVAEDAQVSRESLYRTLSEDGNPRLDTLNAVLEAVGLRLSVEAICETTTGSAAELVQNPPTQTTPVVLSAPKEPSALARFLAIPSRLGFSLVSHANH